MVHVKDKPEIQIINEDTCVYMGQKITLSVANINDNQISWNQDNQILCEDCHDYTFQPMIPGIYTATVTDEMGCQAIDSVLEPIAQLLV